MCHQNITSFLCRCQRMEENECDYARELDVNFWRKIDCPSYSVKRLTVSWNCGAGFFYCSESGDGKTFDTIDARHQTAIQATLACHSTVERQKQLLLERRDEWIADGGLQTAFASSKAVHAEGVAMQEMYQEWLNHQQEAASWGKVKHLAKTHFDDQQSRQQRGLPPAPSFASFLEYRYPQVHAILHDESAPANSSLKMWSAMLSPTSTSATPDSSRPSKGTKSHGTPQKPRFGHHSGTFALGSLGHSALPNPLSSNVRLTPQVSRGKDTEGRGVHSVDPAVLRAQQLAAQDAIPEVRAFQQKRAMAKRRAELPKSPDKSVNGVRRSTRVKDKQVNYAVDEMSEQSQSPSPGKSEASVFSPEKFDLYQPSERSGRRIKTESSGLRDSMLDHRKDLLADKIGEWHRRDRIVASPHTPSAAPRTQTRGRKRAAEDEDALQPRRTTMKQEGLPHSRRQTRQTSGYAAASFHAGPQVQSELSPAIDPTKRPATAPTPPYRQERSISNTPARAVDTSVATPGSALPNPLAAGTLNRSFSMPMTQSIQQRHSFANHLAVPASDQNHQTEFAPPSEQQYQEQMVGNELLPDPSTGFDNTLWPEIDWTLFD